MAAPLYFLPKAEAGQVAPGGTLNRSELANRGLAEAFADVKSTQIDAAMTELAGRGPDGSRGVILCALPTNGSPPRRLGYYPHEQEWTAAGDGSLLWIGLDPADRPGPACLSRKQRFRGHPVELADGQTWEVPIIRSPSGATSIPRSMGWDQAGAFRMRVKQQYLAAWDESEATAAFFFDPDAPKSLEFETVLQRCLQALSINYRLGPLEQSVLDLVDTTNWEEVLGATVDVPTVERLAAEEKKRREIHGSPSSTPGGEASPPTTAPAEESCISPH
jgi:hypothetical protein